ncbi:MAG: CPBP family intramembrane metalloprotease [Clostridia bacterium]|nr:CPBP family intramembrane metalloprotease [Clostridia bacterium]
MNKTFKKILIALGVSLAFMLGYSLMQLLFTLAFMLYYSVTAAGADLTDVHGSGRIEKIMYYVQQKTLGQTGLIVLISGLISIAIMLLVILLLKKKNKWDMAKIFNIPHKFPNALFLGIACFLLGIIFNVGFVNLMGFIPFPESWIEANNESVGAILSGNLVAALLATSLMAPVAEEIIFRGVFYTMFRDALPVRRRIAVLISCLIVSIVFGVYHGNILQGLYTFLFSILLVLIYERTGSIWSPILVHAGFNSAWLLEMFFARLFAEDKALVHGIVFTAMALLLTAGVFLLSGYGKKDTAEGDHESADPADHSDLNS